MIVEVKQRNESKQFFLDFICDNIPINTCSQSSFTHVGKIELGDTKLLWNWSREPISKIPFKKFLGGKKKNYRDIIEKNLKVGHMYTFSDAASTYYIFKYKKQTFNIYRKIAGKIFFSIYLNNIQIAAIVKDNLITDALDTYTIFLLDEYREYLKIIMLFNGYIDNYYYGHKRAAFYGISYNNINASTKTDNFFNKEWYNYFGVNEEFLQSITWFEAKEKIRNYKRT